jgi:hypothetical protein
MTHLRGLIIRHIKAIVHTSRGGGLQFASENSWGISAASPSSPNYNRHGLLMPTKGTKAQITTPAQLAIRQRCNVEDQLLDDVALANINVERETVVLSLKHSLFRRPSTKCLTSDPQQASLNHYPCPDKGNTVTSCAHVNPNHASLDCRSLTRMTSHATPPRFGQSLYKGSHRGPEFRLIDVACNWQLESNRSN